MKQELTLTAYFRITVLRLLFIIATRNYSYGFQDNERKYLYQLEKELFE